MDTYILSRLYATFVMVGSIKDELEAMRQGLTDVIPAELLSGLTAEVCNIWSLTPHPSQVYHALVP